MTTAAARDKDGGFTAFAFVLALLSRLYVAIAWAREPVWDGHYYDFGARRIAAGLGYSDDIVVGGQTVWHPWCHYPVGYSGLLALVYRVFGDGPLVAPVTNAVIGALIAAVVHRLARYATSKARARLAAVLVAVHPELVVYAALLMTEPLAALGVMLSGWLFVRDRRDRPLRGALTAGLALGLTALVRPQSLLCLPALVLLLPPGHVAAKRGVFSLGGSWWRRAAIAGAAAAVAAAMAVAPWTARNCRVMDGCVLVSTNAGWNLAIGAFPRATGRFETLRATDGCPIVTGQAQQDRCWRKEALRWIQEAPGRWISLVPKKLGHTFDHASFPAGYLGEANPSAWPEPRRAALRGMLSAAHRVGLVAAALAFAAWPLARGRARTDRLCDLLAIGAVALLAAHGSTAREPSFWPIAVLIPILAAIRLPGEERAAVPAFLAFLVGTVCLTHAVFFGEDRYHVVMTPALCLLAACALGLGRAPAALGRSAR